MTGELRDRGRAVLAAWRRSHDCSADPGHGLMEQPMIELHRAIERAAEKDASASGEHGLSRAVKTLVAAEETYDHPCEIRTYRAGSGRTYAVLLHLREFEEDDVDAVRKIASAAGTRWTVEAEEPSFAQRDEYEARDVVVTFS